MNGGLGLGITLNAKNNAGPAITQLSGQLGGLKNAANQAGQAMGRMGSDGRMRDAKGKFTSGGGKGGGLFGGGGGGGGGIFGGGGTSSLRNMELQQVAGDAQALGSKMMGVGAAALNLAGASDKLDRGLARLGVISGATAGEMDLFRQTAIDAGTGLRAKFTPDQAVDALTSLSSAGLTAREAMDALQGTLNLTGASNGMMTTDQAAKLTAQSLKGFGIAAKDSGPMLDKLVQTANAFSVEIQDLPLLLANSQRGSSALGAGLGETLVALGLTRNLMPRVESAATAVGVAMESLGDPKVAAKLKGLGISVADSNGKFRPFLDTIGDMIPKLSKMTDVERAAFLQGTFGADAMQGLNAIFTQLKNGVPDATGKLLKGAEAIKFLRGQMDSSSGTLSKFSDAATSGMGGAMDALKASATAAAQVLGGPLGKAFEPATRAVQSFVGWLTRGVESLPTFAKAGLGKLLGVLVAVVAGGGGLLAAGAALGMLVVALKAAGAAIAVVFLPALVFIGAFAAGVIGLKYAVDRNIGGLGDKFREVGAKILLGWRALSELFTKGVFSEGLKKELFKAENSGLRHFVENVFLFAMRMKHFFGQLKAGFGEAMAKMGPSFERLKDSFLDLAEMLGLTTDKSGGAKAAWEAFGNAGRKVGGWIAGAIDIVVRAIAAVMEASRGFISKWGEIKTALAPAREALSSIGSTISEIVGKIGKLVPSGASGWTAFGQTVGGVVAGIGTTISSFLKIVASIGTVVKGVVNVVQGIFTGDWSRIWEGAKQIVSGMVDGVKELVLAMIRPLMDMMKAAEKVTGKALPGLDEWNKVNASISDEIAADQAAKKFNEAHANNLALLQEGEAMAQGAAAAPAAPVITQAEIAGAMATALAGLKIPAPVVNVALDGSEILAVAKRDRDSR